MVPLQVLDHGGGGAGVLLLHGGGRTSRDWDELAGRLGPLGYRVVAVDLRGHGGTPVGPVDLGPVQSSLAPMAATLTAHLREVMRSVDELDLFEVYRQVRCPLVIVSGQRSMAELLPAQAQEPWMAYERWVQVQLDWAAADNPAVTLVRLPTGHDPHLEAPEAVASLIHRYGAGG
jgi:pimeloyl-ACP methyl ester carboxylesterase